MAEIKNNIDQFFNDLSSGATWNVGVSIARKNALPLDNTSVFKSYSELTTYVANGMSYMGQPVAVINEDGSVDFYVLDANKVPQGVGKATVGDDKSITLDNGVLKLFDFDSAPEGAQLSKSGGKLVWALPDTTTAEGQIAAIAALQAIINGTTGENPTEGLVKKVADNRQSIKANTDAITVLNGDTTKEGSVAYQIAQIVGGAGESFDTLKEIADWIAKHPTDAAEYNTRITANEEAIADLEDLVGTTAVATQIANKVEEALFVEGIEKYALASALTTLAGRVTAVEKLAGENAAAITTINQTLDDHDADLETAKSDIESLKTSSASHATSAYVDTELAKKADKTELDNYYTKDAIDGKGFAIAEEVTATFATKKEFEAHTTNAANTYAVRADVETALNNKIETGSISHSTETVAENVTVEGTKLNIVVDAYTKEETLAKIQEKITEVNGGESAGEVLSQLNSYKETNDARVGAIEAKNAEQSTAIVAAQNQANKGVADAANVANDLATANTTIEALQTTVSGADGHASRITALEDSAATLASEDTRLAGLIDSKANAADVYTKSEADEALRVSLQAAKDSGEFDGKDGEDGAEGGHYTPSVKDNGNGTMTVSFTASKSDMPSVNPITITLPVGKDGEDGADGGYYTPSVQTVTDTTFKISFTTSKNGMPPVSDVTITLPTANDGEDGTDGTDGVGIESIVQTTTSTADGGENVITVTLTDNTESTFKVKNGSKGSAGRGISKVEKTSTNELTDTYTITYTDGTTSTFTVVNGKNGTNGVGIKTVAQTTTSSADGGENVITVTLTNGSTSTFKVKNGSKGNAGNGIKSVAKTSTSGLVDTYTITFTDNTTATFTVTNGNAGTSVTVSSVTESTDSGGSNIVNFSDGKTLTVKNGKDGKAPVKGTDYWTEADKTEIKNYVNSNVVDKLTLGINPADGLLYIYNNGIAIGSGVEISGGGESIGYVDVATNTIIINTSLGDGSYVVQYEMEDGTTTYIGQLDIDTRARYSVTNNLTKCSNTNTVAQVIGGESYTALIKPDTGYIVETITVTMGGNDITSTAVEGNTISIARVDGAIVITATAIEQAVSNNPTITNNLTNCSNSNTTTEVVSGNSYSATISTTPAYALSTLKVLMGGTDISSSAITRTTTGATISISSVTEDVTITAAAVPNLIATSTDNTGKVFNTTGYQSGMSQSSSAGTISAQSGYNVTGFIPVVANQTIRVKNIDVSTDNSRNNVVFYDSSYTRVAAATLKSMFTSGGTNEGNGVYSRKLTGFTTELSNGLSKIAHMRFSSPKIDSTSVIVVNQTII